MDFERYNTTAFGYWDRSRRILGDFEQSRHQLFYAAFELRCGIEAFSQDYLYFLRDGQLSRALRKLYRPTDLKKVILKLDPDFEIRIRFGNILHAALGLSVISIPVPDLNRLGVLYGRLGSFMHIQREAMESASAAPLWLELESLVKETQAYMHDIVHPQKAHLELTAEGLKLFEEFKSGAKTPEEVEATARVEIKKYLAGARYLFENRAYQHPGCSAGQPTHCRASSAG